MAHHLDYDDHLQLPSRHLHCIASLCTFLGLWIAIEASGRGSVNEGAEPILILNLVFLALTPRVRLT